MADRVGGSTTNAKHIGMPADGPRILKMVSTHRKRRVGWGVCQEANGEGYWTLLAADGIGVSKGLSNGGSGWTGTLIWWDEDAGYELVKAWQASRRYLYVPKRRPWRARRVTNHVPMVRLRAPNGRLFNVRGDHVPTARNSKEAVRLRAWRLDRLWLTTRIIPSFLALDANKRKALKEGRRCEVLAAHGVDQIYGNGRMRVRDKGYAPFRRLGLSDHDAPWVIVDLPRRRRPRLPRRPRVPKVTAAGLLTSALRFVLTPPKEKP